MLSIIQIVYENGTIMIQTELSDTVIRMNIQPERHAPLLHHLDSIKVDNNLECLAGARIPKRCVCFLDVAELERMSRECLRV